MNQPSRGHVDPRALAEPLDDVDSMSTNVAVAYGQWALGLVFLVTFIFFGFSARFSVPYRDDWDWLLALLTRGTSLRALFEPHNEHLIPLPRLLVALQYRLEGSSGYLMFLTALIAQIAVGWLFRREIRRRWSSDPSTARFVFGLTCTFLFFSYQLQSIVFMAAILFPLVQAFAAAAITCMLNASDREVRQRSVWFAGALLATLGATLTTTNGLVVSYILAAMAFMRRQRGSVVAAFLTVGSAYLVGYLLLVEQPWLQAAPRAGAVWSVPSVRAMAAFFVSFFGSGLVYFSGTGSIIVGSVMLAVGCYSIRDVARLRERAPRIEAFAVGLMVFAIASAAMAAPARAQFGTVQAAQSRYATYTLVYWSGLIIWLASRFPLERISESARSSLMLCASAASCGLFLAHLFLGMVWQAKADNVKFAGLALAAGVDDDPWISTLHPLTSVIYAARTHLQAAGDSSLLHLSMSKAVNVRESLDLCEGLMALSGAVPSGGWRVVGDIAVPASTGLIADGGGVVRGLARPAPLLAFPNPSQLDAVRAVWRSLRRREQQNAQRRWLGFVQQGARPYMFYAFDGRERAVCRMNVN